MKLDGVDYDDGRPGGAALAAAGKSFAIRYLGYRGNPDPHKPLTLGEIQDLRNHGIAVVANFESSSTRMLDGALAGEADATDALADLRGLGFPPTCPVYFSADFDAKPVHQARIDAYLTAAASVLGKARVGVYGSYSLLVRCRQNGTAPWFWMSAGWDGGKAPPAFAHLWQYQTGGMGAKPINGAAVDLDRALKANYGQWDAPGGAGPEDPIVRSFYVDDPKPAMAITPKADPAIRMLNLVLDALVPVPPDFDTRTGHPTVIKPGIGVPLETAGYLVTYRAAPMFLIASNVTAAPLPTDCSAAIAAATEPLEARIEAAKTALG